MRAQFPGQRPLVLSAGDGHGAIAALGRILHCQVTEAADAENRHSVAGPRTAVAQRVEGGDAGAEQRGGIHVAQIVWDEREGIGRGYNVIRIAAVEADAGDLLVFAEDEIAAAAGRAIVAVAAVPTQSHALPYFEERHIRAHFVDHARHLMARNARVV